MHVAVIGAGAFGGWIATCLRERGAAVTLVDAWGPGNSRSTSGGETRIIRTMYGEDLASFALAVRALQLWREYESRWNTRLFHPSGMAFLARADDAFVASSILMLRAAGIAVEQWTTAEARRRFPQVNLDGIDSIVHEPGAGVLTARQNCRLVVKRFVENGGAFHIASVRPPAIAGELDALQFSDGSRLQADGYVFACGPWLASLFPDVLGRLIRISRQEVFFVGVPAGDNRFSLRQFPCWADRTSAQAFYGIPDFEHRGFKLAADVRGEAIDPSAAERVVTQEQWERARAFLRLRFPKLGDAPLLESRVCQYENTPDLGLIVDRHPRASNVWLVGGGSGQGYKHGPALGEYASDAILGGRFDAAFALARFH